MSVPSVTLTVRLFAGLESRGNGRQDVYKLVLADTPTIAVVLERLGLDPGATGLVLVNGLHASTDQRLWAGDEVSLFPPLGGG